MSILEPVEDRNNRDIKAKRVQARNYAAPGATIEDDLEDQLTQFFAQYPKKSGPQDSPHLDPDTTLYGMC